MTPELAERLVWHDQTIARALESLQEIPGGLGSEPVQIKQHVRVDSDDGLSEGCVDLLR